MNDFDAVKIGQRIGADFVQKLSSHCSKAQELTAGSVRPDETTIFGKFRDGENPHYKILDADTPPVNTA